MLKAFGYEIIVFHTGKRRFDHHWTVYFRAVALFCNNFFISLFVSFGSELNGRKKLRLFTWSATTEWRLQRKFDVLLRVKSDNERWDVDNLLSHSLKISKLIS
jgi:hypothetical protein